MMSTDPTASVIIDCDPGHDDAVAILLAHKFCHIHGITTVSGNAPVAAVTTNALALVAMLQADIPVFAGAAKPLTGQAKHATHVHGDAGFGGVDLPPPSRRAEAGDAVSFLLEASRNIERLNIIAIGPLTNIALAMQQDAKFAQRLYKLYIMGGSTGSGNATPAAEFNFFADPEAAKMVFESACQPVMCGLNLTRQVNTDDALLARLSKGGRIAKFVAHLYAFMHERMQTLTGQRRAALHDPCAVMALTHPELFQFEHLPVRIETHREFTRGMSLVDQRDSLSKAAANAHVGMKVDADALLEIVETTLLSYR